MINQKLADAKQLSSETVSQINNRHTQRDSIEASINMCVNTYNRNKTAQNRSILLTMLDNWRTNETGLQKLWGFEENTNYFKEWNLPGCTCPKLDNEDAYPSGYYTISLACPIHGDGT